VLLHDWPEFSGVWEPVISALYWGERDPVLRAEWMDRLPETFANMRALVAKVLGHFVHYESPERRSGEWACLSGRRKSHSRHRARSASVRHDVVGPFELGHHRPHETLTKSRPVRRANRHDPYSVIRHLEAK
jgi:hypothetical protein